MSDNKPKGIFMSTIELLGSIILFMIFITIVYGIFSGTFENMLWKLFDWLVEILKPIVAIIILLIGVFRGLPLIWSFCEGLYLDMRLERSVAIQWDRFENPSPTSKNVPQITSTVPPESQKVGIPTESRGGFDWSKYKPGSAEASAAYKASDEHKEAMDKIQKIDTFISEQRRETIKENAQKQTVEFNREVLEKSDAWLRENVAPRLIATYKKPEPECDYNFKE